MKKLVFTLFAVLSFSLSYANSLEIPIKSVTLSESALVCGDAQELPNSLNEQVDYFGCSIHAEFTHNGIDYTLDVIDDDCGVAFDVFFTMLEDIGVL